MQNRSVVRVRRWVTFVVLVFLLLWSMQSTGVNLKALLDMNQTVSFITEHWLPPDWSSMPEALRNSLVTLQIAFVGTTFGLLIGMLLSFLAARSTPLPRVVHGFVRLFLSFVRSVPEIVWGLLFVPTIGLGPFGGILAIMLHNIGVLGKLIAELIEASDKEPQEGIIATGGNRLHVLGLAIIPEILPNIFSQYFYRLEVAVRTSLVLGFIGAGGLGNMLFIDFKVFEYQSVAVEVLVIMLLVIVIDAVGGWVRRRMI